jgi:hypothetical protein
MNSYRWVIYHRVLLFTIFLCGLIVPCVYLYQDDIYRENNVVQSHMNIYLPYYSVILYAYAIVYCDSICIQSDEIWKKISINCPRSLKRHPEEVCDTIDVSFLRFYICEASFLGGVPSGSTLILYELDKKHTHFPPNLKIDLWS